MAKVHEIRVGSKSFHCYKDGDVKYIAFPEFVDVWSKVHSSIYNEPSERQVCETKADLSKGDA